MIQVGGVPTPQELSDSKVNLGNPNNPVDATYTSGGTGISTDIIWTRDSGSIYPTTIADKVSIGTTTFVANEKLRVAGYIDTDSLRVANAYIDYGRYRSGIYYASLYTSALTSSRTIILPNKSGTVVLDIDLPANLTLLGTYNQTNTDISNAISLSHTHSNYSDLNGITSTLINNWNTAYSYGDWRVAGFLLSETDPVFGASEAAGISHQNILDWSTAYGWGNHALAGYLTAETDPVFMAHDVSSITGTDIASWIAAELIAHTHTNKTLLDSLLSTGSASLFLAADGDYHTIPISVPGADKEIVFNDGGSTLGSDSSFTFNKSDNTLTVEDVVISHILSVGGSTIRTTGGDLLFNDGNGNNTTLAYLLTASTNYWTATTGGIYYANYISNHIDPTAELDITGHIIADNFDSNYIRYKSSNLLIGPNAGDNEAGSNLLYIDNTNTGSPLIKGDFLTRYLEFNAQVFLKGELNFTDANTSIFDDLTYLYVKDAHIGTKTLYSFIDGTVNALVADFDDLATVQGIQASDLAVWNKAAAIVTSGPGTNYLSDDGTYNAISSSGVTPTDYIFKFDTGSVYYRPYTDKTEAGGVASAGKFYNGTIVPSATNRLNYDGNFHATNITVVNKLTVGGLIDPTGIQLTPISANPGDTHTLWEDVGDGYLKYNTEIIYPGLSSDTTIGALSDTDWATFSGKQDALTTSSNISIKSIIATETSNQAGRFISGSNIAAYFTTESTNQATVAISQGTTLASNRTANVLLIERITGGAKTADTTGNIIQITDNPTTSGTISGKVLTATIGTTERISFNPRVASTGSAVSYFLDTHSSMTTDKLLSVRNIGNEKFYLDGLGNILATGALTAGSSTNGSILGSTGYLNLVFSSANKTSLNPAVVNGASAIAYIFDTTNALSTAGAKIVSIKNSGSEKVAVTKDGNIYQTGTYAGIYVSDGVTAQNIPTGTTYTKMTHFATNGESSNCTADATNDKITITKTGRYLVSWSMAFSLDTNNVNLKVTAFLNGVEQNSPHGQRKISTGADVGSVSGGGFISVTTAPWDLDLRCRHDAVGTVAVTPIYSNLTINYVGE